MPLYKLPDNLRARLAKPIGKLLRNKEEIPSSIKGKGILVSVGDATTELLVSMGFVPDIQVVDGKEGRATRKAVAPSHFTELEVLNPPGHISQEAIEAIRRALSSERPVRILVEGEEDLLSLPFLAIYPRETMVMYGQPGEGVVLATTNSPAREFALAILDRMKIPKGLLKPPR